MTRIIFIGDSITKGTDYGGVTSSQTFVNLIGTSHGYTNIINAGVSSDNTSGVNSRLNTDVIDKQPSVCVLMIGANDFLQSVQIEQYRQNIENILSRLKSAKIKTVILSSVPLRGGNESFAGFQNYLRILEEEASYLQVPIIDVYREFLTAYFYIGASSFASLYVDNIHLTAIGHKFVSDFATRKANSKHFIPS